MKTPHSDQVYGLGQDEHVGVPNVVCLPLLLHAGRYLRASDVCRAMYGRPRWSK